MPLPQDKAMLGNVRELKPVKIKVLDIKENPEPGENQWGNPDKPYLVSYNIGGKKFEFGSTSVVKPKDWNNCFKLSDKGFVQYKRWSDHLMNLIIVKDGLEASLPYNVNSLIDFEFEAEFVEIEGKDPFIDWMTAFELKKIITPKSEQLDPLGMSEPTTNTPAENADDGDLPF